MGELDGAGEPPVPLAAADNALYIPIDQPGYDSLFKVRPLLDHLPSFISCKRLLQSSPLMRPHISIASGGKLVGMIFG